MLLRNNQRKMAGLPLHRKKDSRKRFYTRNEASEAIDAFLDYCNGVHDVRKLSRREKEMFDLCTK